ETLTTYRQAMSTRIVEHGGRVVDHPGDSLLAEFPSAVEAVQCAVEIQRDLHERNALLPENRRMRLRIGVTLGDVIEQDSALYGDGVNIAARLQALAEAGGICVSGTVFEQVEGKLALDFAAMGEQQVKNIAKPIRVYRVLQLEVKTKASWWRRKASAAPALIRRKFSSPTFIALTALVLIGGVWGVTRIEFPLRPADSVPTATPQDRASIAVLPFANLSGDPADVYFSDGITEDVIVALGRFSNLSVMSRNAVFKFKDKQLSAPDIGRELGVQYLVEGSVRKAGERIRVSVQLTDAQRGTLLWSARYDDELKDVFAREDEIMRSVAGALAAKLKGLEQERAWQKPTENLQAYDYVLRARQRLARAERDANIEAQSLLEKAVELDPKYAAAHVTMGTVLFDRVSYGWTEAPGETLEQVEALAKKALSLGESTGTAHRLLAAVYLYRHQYDLAMNESELAISLNPSDADSYGIRGSILLFAGKIDDALRSLEQSHKLDPNTKRDNFVTMGVAYYMKRRYDDALRVLQRGAQLYPDDGFNYAVTAAVYGQLGQRDEAARMIAEVRRFDPFFDAASFGALFKDPSNQFLLVEGLRKAGFN
ncbi:MAG: adenylate/guanylate cyclase domain-containing protein, partial [Burkholderiales bacterium]